MDPVIKSDGTTQSEKYLARLCEQTFLSLWSYPNVFTPEGRRNGKGAGKELCDLLVVFGADVIVFSDKDISFNSAIDIKVAWNRWRKRAILGSVNQLFGAEKWIREHPTELYLDAACSMRFPLDLESEKSLRFHLIGVTKNTNAAAQLHFGGGSSGSFVNVPSLSEKQIADRPFTINDVNPQKTFVHIFDEYSLNVVFEEIDTVYDFVRYLRAKEEAIRSSRISVVHGEEDLLAHYMQSGGLVNAQPFKVPFKLRNKFKSLVIGEGLWREYEQSDIRRRLREANHVSYFWDSLIENFSKHIRDGTVAINAEHSVSSHEKTIRMMAAEGRIARRMLSELFLEKLESVPPDRRSSRICQSPFKKETCFVLVLYPRAVHQNYEDYRKERIDLLHSYALVILHKRPELKFITIVGTEPKGSTGRSEDVLSLERHNLSLEDRALAKRLMEEEHILDDVTHRNESGFVVPRSSARNGRQSPLGRNSPCPCGSGQKYKKCCGK